MNTFVKTDHLLKLSKKFGKIPSETEKPNSQFASNEHRRAERGARPIYLTRSWLTFRGGGRPEVLSQVKSQ